MRIALVALHFAEYASRLALALSVKHKVLLVLRTSNVENELPDHLRSLLQEAVTVRFIEPRRRRDPRILGTGRWISRIVQDFSPDLVHIQEMHPILGGWALLSLRRSMPVVVTVHDPVQHSGGLPKDAWRWKVVMWFRRRASRLIVHGPRMQTELRELDERLGGRIDVVPHGILGRGLVDSETSGYEAGTFLFFGRIQPYKGLRYFLDAGDILHRRGHAFRLVVAGTGKDLDLHRRRIASSTWVELVERYIPPAEVPVLFRGAMAVVLPYTDATQSGVCAMAFAHSRPVIATDVGDMPESVIDGHTGLIVPPRDATALANAMERLLIDHRLRASLASGAGRFAAERLTWPRIAELTEGTYRRAVASYAAGDTSRFPSNRGRVEERK